MANLASPFSLFIAAPTLSPLLPWRRFNAAMGLLTPHRRAAKETRL
jgi:hypothetical protein